VNELDQLRVIEEVGDTVFRIPTTDRKHLSAHERERVVQLTGM
jgi:hypothetical protein